MAEEEGHASTLQAECMRGSELEPEATSHHVVAELVLHEIFKRSVARVVQVLEERTQDDVADPPHEAVQQEVQESLEDKHADEMKKSLEAWSEDVLLPDGEGSGEAGTGDDEGSSDDPDEQLTLVESELVEASVAKPEPINTEIDVRMLRSGPDEEERGSRPKIMPLQGPVVRGESVMVFKPVDLGSLSAKAVMIPVITEEEYTKIIDHDDKQLNEELMFSLTGHCTLGFLCKHAEIISQRLFSDPSEASDWLEALETVKNFNPCMLETRTYGAMRTCSVESGMPVTGSLELRQDRTRGVDAAHLAPSSQRPLPTASWGGVHACRGLVMWWTQFEVLELGEGEFFATRWARTRTEAKDRHRVELARKQGRILYGARMSNGFEVTLSSCGVPHERMLCGEPFILKIIQESRRSNYHLAHHQGVLFVHCAYMPATDAERSLGPEEELQYIEHEVAEDFDSDVPDDPRDPKHDLQDYCDDVPHVRVVALKAFQRTMRLCVRTTHAPSDVECSHEQLNSLTRSVQIFMAHEL